MQTVIVLGSKSERSAVIIASNKGEFVLHRSGGNPFVDPDPDKLVGKQTQCEGSVHGQCFTWTTGRK